MPIPVSSLFDIAQQFTSSQRSVPRLMSSVRSESFPSYSVCVCEGGLVPLINKYDNDEMLKEALQSGVNRFQFSKYLFCPYEILFFFFFLEGVAGKVV